MIALTVWLLPGAGSARILVIAVVTYFISPGGFAHGIAGSAEAAYASFAGVASWTPYFTGFLLPALLGNVIGGVVLVATLNHLQVRSAATAAQRGRGLQPGGDAHRRFDRWSLPPTTSAYWSRYCSFPAVSVPRGSGGTDPARRL